MAQLKSKNSETHFFKVSHNYYGKPSERIWTLWELLLQIKLQRVFMLKKIYEEAGLKVGIIGTVYVKIDNFDSKYLFNNSSLDLQKYLSIFRKEKLIKLLWKFLLLLGIR